MCGSPVLFHSKGSPNVVRPCLRALVSLCSVGAPRGWSVTALRLHSMAPHRLCPVSWHEPALMTAGRCSGGGLPAGVQPVSCWAQRQVTHSSGPVAGGMTAGSEMSAQHQSVVDPLTPCSSPEQSPDGPGDLEGHSKRTPGHAGDSFSYKALLGFPHPTALRRYLRSSFSELASRAITRPEQLGPPYAPHTALLFPVQVTHRLGPRFTPCSHPE